MILKRRLQKPEGRFDFCRFSICNSKKQDGFIKYNDQLFTWNAPKKRGAIIILTNVNCKEICEIYISGGFFIKDIKRVMARYRTGIK